MKKTLNIFPLITVVFFFFFTTAAESQDAPEKYPVGIITDTPGILISPFPPGRKLDVTGLKPGSLAMDPSVEKIFRIPSSTPSTKGNVGKKPSSYEDYAGTKTNKPSVTPNGKPIPETPVPESPSGSHEKVMPSNNPPLPQIVNPDSRFERPRDPGLGGSLPPSSPSSETTDSGLPKDLEKFVYSFNETSSDNTPDATIAFYDTKVLYFGKRNQTHNDIAKDRAAYIKKYPYRKYRITSEPVILSAKNGVYELALPISYTVQGIGRPISGKVADYLVVRKTPERYLIVGIDETKAGASRPDSLHREAQRQQELNPTPLQDPVAIVKKTPLVFTGDAEEQVEQLVAAFVKSGEDNDPAACLQFVDSEVAVYYDLERPDQAKLLKDRSDYIKQWPRRKYALTGDPEIKGIGDRIYEATFQISYQVRNNKRTLVGREHSVMHVAETERGLKIISVFSE